MYIYIYVYIYIYRCCYIELHNIIYSKHMSCTVLYIYICKAKTCKLNQVDKDLDEYLF